MSLSIILLFPTSFIVGMSYYGHDSKYRFDELNVYLFLIQLQIRWYE